MYFIKKLIYCFRITQWIYPLCGGIVALLLGCVTLVCCSCHPMYHFLLLPRNALPYWIFLGLSLFLFVLLGMSTGFLPALPGCHKKQYLPILYLALAGALMIVWFHVIFRSFSFLLGGFILLGIIGILVLVFLKTIEICAPTALLVLLSILILLHYLWLNLGLLMLN